MLTKLRGTSKEAVQPELEGLQALVIREFKEEPKISDLWATRGNVKALGKYTNIPTCYDGSVSLYYIYDYIFKMT